MDEFNKRFLDMIANSIEINKLYNELFIEILSDMIDGDKYKEIISEISDLVNEDNLIYNNLGNEEVNLYLEKINMMDDDNDNDIIYRIKIKLTDRERILANTYDNVVINGDIFKNVYGEFMLSDIIEYGILVDTYNNAYRSIINAYTDNDGDELIKRDLFNNLYISLIKSISSFGMAELIVLESEMNIDKLPLVDVDDMNNKYAKLDKSMYYYALVSIVTPLIDDALQYTNNNNSLTDIFNTLIILAEIDAIIHMIDGEYLDNVIEYFNFNASFIENSLSKVNVRRLIRERNNELGR